MGEGRISDMKKGYKLLLTDICLFLILAGCSRKEDYREYKDKIWVMEEVQGKEDVEEEEASVDIQSPSFSFRIREIDKDHISGEISITEEEILEEYFDSFSIEEKKGSFSGKITDGIAICNFDDSKGNHGTFTIRKWSNGSLMVEMEYNEKTWENRKAEDGTYSFRPYSVSDIKGFSIQEEEREINLADGGRAKLVTGQMKDEKEGFAYPQAYVTDMDGIILYRLDMGILFGTEISDIRLEDTDGNGTEDVSIIIRYSMENVEDREGTIEWTYNQKSEGEFELKEEEMDYERYLRKVWVVKANEGDNVYGTDVEFRITDIRNGIVKGNFCVGELVDMTSVHVSNFEGRIINNVADCIITTGLSGNDDYGRVVLKFCDYGNIEVLSKYNCVYQHEVFERYEGRYLCKPYNISDMRGREIIDEYTFESKVDGWGDIWIVTMLTDVFPGKGYYFSEAYITTTNRDVLFKFDVNSDPYLKVSNIVIEDYDGNGVEDVEFYLTMTKSHDEEVMHGETKNTIINVFKQSSPGEFEGENILDAETGEECIPYEVYYRY